MHIILFITLYVVGHKYFVSPSLSLVSFGQLLHYVDKRIVDVGVGPTSKGTFNILSDEICVYPVLTLLSCTCSKMINNIQLISPVRMDNSNAIVHSSLR